MRRKTVTNFPPVFIFTFFISIAIFAVMFSKVKIPIYSTYEGMVCIEDGKCTISLLELEKVPREFYVYKARSERIYKILKFECVKGKLILNEKTDFVSGDKVFVEYSCDEITLLEKIFINAGK